VREQSDTLTGLVKKLDSDAGAMHKTASLGAFVMFIRRSRLTRAWQPAEKERSAGPFGICVPPPTTPLREADVPWWFTRQISPSSEVVANFSLRKGSD